MDSTSRNSILAVCLLLTMITVWYFSRGGYGEIGPQAYELSKALYSITNRHDAARLDALASRIESSRSSAEITATEANWLAGIVEQARHGQWAAATKSARRLLEDQVQGR